MTIEEISNEFDILVASYKRFKAFDNREILDSIEFNEYEKSVFLTNAQEEIVINLYNGKNPYGDSFESTEELRRYLDSLVKIKEYNIDEQVEGIKLESKSVLFQLPEFIAFITMERVVYDDESLGCANGTVADVYPVTQDEYNRLRDNPFRGSSKYKALRLDYGDNIVEIIPKYNIGKYIIKYLSKPSPIILTDLPEGLKVDNDAVAHECQLNSMLHRTILERAVSMALASKGISIDK